MSRILLIVGGGIAAYKSCELIRLCRARAIDVRCVLTASGARFVSALTLSALSENLCDTSLWTLDESQMGHIRLSREADLVVVVPATADLLARMASGVADDLATTLLLATDKPVLAAPAMNVRMWEHPATRRNIARLRADGVTIIEPEAGPMACGEVGVGRLADITTIADAIDDALRLVRRGAVIASTSAPTHGAAATASIARAAAAAPVSGSGLHVVVTAGPTREPIDPVRYLANRSSGRQGFAVAAAFAALGARVSLITGPVELATPDGVERVDVETACEMAAAVDAALPADAAILVAAVADWRVAASPQKIKKTGAPTTLTLIPNPDILATLGSDPRRPRLVIGFAAETERLVEHARAKLVAKRADWIVANDVSGDVMGGMSNEVQLITLDTTEAWERLPKEEVAARLALRVVAALGSADAPAAAS